MSRFPAPFLSERMTVEPGFADYNGHMNVAYYVLLFDRCVDAGFALAGLGPDYVRERNMSFFSAELHVRYLRELRIETEVVVALHLLEVDDKRLRYVQEMRHADEGWLAATKEGLSLHVDLAARRAAPFPADLRAALDAMQAAHAGLPRPDWAGRGIGARG